MLKEKIWASFKELENFLHKNLSLTSQKYGFGIRDPGFGKNLFRIPDPDPQYDPQYWGMKASLCLETYMSNNYLYLPFFLLFIFWLCD
jgi:hypothetical protein